MLLLPSAQSNGCSRSGVSSCRREIPSSIAAGVISEEDVTLYCLSGLGALSSSERPHAFIETNHDAPTLTQSDLGRAEGAEGKESRNEQ